MIRKAYSFYYLIFFISISLLIWLTLHFDHKNSTQLEAIINSQEIRISTTNSADTYFLEKNQPTGFEYELARAFADELGVKLALNVRKTTAQVADDLRLRDSQIGIFGRSDVKITGDKLVKSLSYMKSQSVVVYRETRGKKYPRNIQDILDRTNLVSAESYQELQMLAQQRRFAALEWISSKNLTTYEILDQLLSKTIDTAIISASQFAAFGPFFPGLKVAFNLDDPINISWLLAAKEDQSLANRLNIFLTSQSTQQLIQALELKYYENSNPLNFFDTISFKKNLEKRIPDLLPYFKQAASENNIEWLLLAAIAYQESHWDPKAVSRTGVKGIMMLTKAAAKEVNVTDRTDPKQSIFGGAQYLRKVKNKIPKRIKEPDRTFLALAGYNTGFGHLEDARILTKRAGFNPDKWEDVSNHLPLLTKKKYYNTVKHGYARGYEPVNYVKNIKEYLTILKWEIEQRDLKKALDSAIKNPQPRTSEASGNDKQAPSTL